MITITGNSFDRGMEAIADWSEEKDVEYNIGYIVYDHGVKTVKFDSDGHFKPGIQTVKSIQFGNSKTGLKLTGSFTGTVTSNEATLTGIISSFKEWDPSGSIEIKGDLEFYQTTTIGNDLTFSFTQGEIKEVILKGTASGTNVAITGLNLSMEEWESFYPHQFFTQISAQDNYYVIKAPLKNDISELVDGGTDTVESQLTYTLSSNVEKLVLAGKKAINGTGNELNNEIAGNNYANLLNGGIGDDFLDGMGGNDRLDGGVGNDALFGGVGNDTIIGGEGNDELFAEGGKDLLTGGLGDDDFWIDIDLVSKSTVTIVTDFNKLGTDSILLFTNDTLYVSDIFDDYGTFYHEVTASEFYAGSGFKNTNTTGQYYVYDTKTGTLYYDEDSFGGVAAVAICILTGNPTLSASDITVTND